MNTSQKDSINYHALLREIFNSLREVGVKIEESTWIIKRNHCSDEGKKILTKYIKNLIDSQFKLAFSLQDIKSKLINTASSDEERERLNRIFPNDKEFIKKVRKR